MARERRDTDSARCLESRRFIRAGVVMVLFSIAAGLHPIDAWPHVTLVIRVKSVPVSGTHHDYPPRGPSKGDRYLVHDRLLNAAVQFNKGIGSLVGRDYSVLILTGPSTGTVTGVATFPDGTIRFEGSGHVSAGASPPIPIVGGTGKYARARGTLIVGAGSEPMNTYRIKLP